MDYKYETVTIPLGTHGLLTDISEDKRPPGSLTLAENVFVRDGIVFKEPGSFRWTTTALATGIVALSDWFPADHIQRYIAVTKDGKLFRFTSRASSAQITAEAGSPAVLLPTQTQTQLVAAGAESSGRDRKMFVFTGINQVQVISGDGTTYRTISNPPTDWTTGRFPTFGLVHQGRLVAFSDHTVWLSALGDHEDFVTGALTFPVYPGEGQRLLGGVSFNKTLVMSKLGAGTYFLDDSSPFTDEWQVRPMRKASIEASSEDSMLELMNDLTIANTTGSVSSLAATEKFGDYVAGDLGDQLGIRKFLKQFANPDGRIIRRSIYDPNLQMARYTYRQNGSINTDGMLNLDFSDPASPKATWTTKDQPNCFAIIKDSRSQPQVMYGADDGFIYMTGHNDIRVGPSTAYLGEFQIGHLDMGHVNPAWASLNKRWDHLELGYEPYNRAGVTAQILVNGRKAKSVTFELSKLPHLGVGTMKTDSATLGVMTPPAIRSVRRQIAGVGRTFSVRISNSADLEGFRIAWIKVYFQVLGAQHKER